MLSPISNISYGLNYAHTAFFHHPSLPQARKHPNSLTNPSLIKIAELGLAAFAHPPSSARLAAGPSLRPCPPKSSMVQYNSGRTGYWACGVSCFALLTVGALSAIRMSVPSFRKVKTPQVHRPAWVSYSSGPHLAYAQWMRHTIRSRVQVSRTITSTYSPGLYIPHILVQPWFYSRTPLEFLRPRTLLFA